MGSLKKKGITLILLIFVYAWFFINHLPSLNQTNLNVLGASSDISLFIQPDAGRSPILNEIDSAEHEILVEVYLLSDKDVISSLCQARAKGLAVDVMLEEHPFGGGKLNPKTKEQLINCDVSVNWTNPSFALTHEKAIIIDSSKAFILNQNLTASSFSKNREYDILDTNPKDVLELRNIFISDWQRNSFIPPNSNLIVSPINSRAAISSLIENSTQSLDIEIEDIDDNQTVSLLSKKAKQEKIRLIIPKLSQITSNKNSVNKLLEAGVSVKALSSPYIHAKLILADGKKAYVGSVNLSSQSMDKNREVGIIISEREIADSLMQTFEKDWNKASPF